MKQIFRLSLLLPKIIAGETERDVDILSKISDILIRLTVNNQAVKWLQKELKLAKHCEVDTNSVAGRYVSLRLSVFKFYDMTLSA